MEDKTLAEKIGWPNAKRKPVSDKPIDSGPWLQTLKRFLSPEPAKAEAKDDPPKESIAERINWGGKYPK